MNEHYTIPLPPVTKENSAQVVHTGPYKLIMNVDEFGVLTMANEVARALFGHTESKEARP